MNETELLDYMKTHNVEKINKETHERAQGLTEEHRQNHERLERIERQRVKDAEQHEREKRRHVDDDDTSSTAFNIAEGIAVADVFDSGPSDTGGGFDGGAGGDSGGGGASF